ncbi:hypothetical protein AcV7_007957 [Taiwanofungus camphoratus]|nr:hypothetical protein AcV7_007957 [Antrodia cinnamomea]
MLRRCDPVLVLLDLEEGKVSLKRALRCSRSTALKRAREKSVSFVGEWLGAEELQKDESKPD